MKNSTYTLVAAVCIAITLTMACGDPGPKNTEDILTEAATDTTPLDEVATFHFSYTIANLPSPLTIFDEVTRANLPVEASLLNPASNSGKYNTALKQAFNYGIYGVDLGYLVINERNTDIYSYYNACKVMAEGLNLGETFRQFVNRFEKHSENRDSLTRVIDEAYAATDIYLRSNERLETASQILAGSWLECQYITVNILRKVERTQENELLYSRIWEQRVYLDNITKVLAEFSGNPEMATLSTEFKKLLDIYQQPVDAKAIDAAMLSKLSTQLSVVRNLIIN